MKKCKMLLKIVSIVLVISVIFSLAGCLAVDQSSKNIGQNLKTEYRHVKNTYHNYIYENQDDSDDYNDSSDFNNQEDVNFDSENINNDINNDSNDNNSDDNNSDDNNSDDNNSDDNTSDDLPEINWDDVTVVPETNIFSDDFENYGEDGTFLEKYEMSASGDNVEGYVTTDAAVGNYAAKFSRTLGSAKWASVSYYFKNDGTEYKFQNWKNQKYLSFWAKTDGKKQAYRVGINDGVRTCWYSLDNIVTDQWTFYSVKLEDFITEDFLLENVLRIGITWDGNTATTYIDDIRVTETEIKQYNKYIPVADMFTIENGEHYEGDELGVKAAYSLVNGNEYVTTAEVNIESTEKKSGNYSIKFTAKPEENKTLAGYTAKLGQQMVVSDFNEVKLNLKGNGQKVNVLFFDGDNQVAGASFDTTTDWAEYKLPVTIPQDKLNLVFDRIVLTTPMSNEDNIFWLDDFAIANKEGVLQVTDGVIENGEFYTDIYKVTDAYRQDENAIVKTTISLDSTFKFEGNNSVKFTIPSTSPLPVDTRVIAEAQSDNIPAWGGTSWIKTVTFDSPMDLSGSAGYINFKANLLKTQKLSVVLKLITENKTSEEMRTFGVGTAGKGFSTGNSVDLTFNLADVGLTDADLKVVKGYYITFTRQSGGSDKANYSISIPKSNTVNSELIYNFQTTPVSEGKHFKFQLAGDNSATKQNIKLEMLDVKGSVIGSKEIEFENDGNWKEFYIANESGLSTVAKTLKITIPATETERTVWLDDFILFVPEEPKPTSPDIVDDFEVYYNEFFPLENYYTLSKSGGYDTNIKISLTDGTESNAAVRNGKYALKFATADFNKGGIYYSNATFDYSSKNIVINPGDDLSVWLKWSGTGSAKGYNCKVTVKFEDGTSKSVTYRLVDTDWHEYKFDLSDITESKKIKTMAYFIHNPGGNTVICVDDFKITRN